MVQLVGRDCVVCHETIRSVRDAEFCPSCGNSVHRPCRAGFRREESGGTTGRCQECGGDPSQAPPAEPEGTRGPGSLITVLIVIAVVALGIFFILGKGGQRDGRNHDTTAQITEDAEPTASTTKEDVMNAEPRPIVEIETTLGTVRAEVYTDKAPNTAQNFIDLVNQSYYDGIIFHRVIKQFMIQTGDPTGTGSGGRTDKGLPEKKLKDEFHPDLRHDAPGILSMANAGPDTGDTQFFITTVPTPWLDNKHAIFGKVIEGIDVVTKIENVTTGGQDRPIEDVEMVTVRMKE